MKRLNTIWNSVLTYLNKVETEKNTTETLNLLMKLILVNGTIKAIETKILFDLEFNKILAQRKKENENDLNAINSYSIQ